MTEDPNATSEDTNALVTREAREHRNWFLALGLVLITLGIAAIAFPFAATLTVEVLIGWILVINGAAGMVHAYRASKWKGFLMSLLTALLSLGVGIILLLHPFTGILSLTLLIAAFFVVSGLFRILLALRVRPLDRWGWIL
jgi:uncharacterized membrane protein HdeD (DUF308 family)